MKGKIITIIISAAAVAALVWFLNSDYRNILFSPFWSDSAVTATNIAQESESETTVFVRDSKDRAGISVSRDFGDFRGHVEKDYYVIDYCNEDAGVIKVPDSIDGYPVKKLGKLSFARRFCKEIIIPDSVEEIGERAFINCEELEKITLGKGLKKMGSEALKSCHVLKAVAFPEGMQEIGDMVFDENENLESIGIPGKDTKIGALIEKSSCPKAVIVTPKDSQADKTAKEKQFSVRN